MSTVAAAINNRGGRHLAAKYYTGCCHSKKYIWRPLGNVEVQQAMRAIPKPGVCPDCRLAAKWRKNEFLSEKNPELALLNPPPLSVSYYVKIVEENAKTWMASEPEPNVLLCVAMTFFLTLHVLTLLRAAVAIPPAELDKAIAEVYSFQWPIRAQRGECAVAFGDFWRDIRRHVRAGGLFPGPGHLYQFWGFWTLQPKYRWFFDDRAKVLPFVDVSGWREAYSRLRGQ